jgi:serine/threonine protein phosphatase PrpC
MIDQNPIKTYIGALVTRALKTKVTDSQLNQFCDILARKYDLADLETKMLEEIPDLWPIVQRNDGHNYAASIPVTPRTSAPVDAIPPAPAPQVEPQKAKPAPEPFTDEILPFHTPKSDAAKSEEEVVAEEVEELAAEEAEAGEAETEESSEPAEEDTEALHSDLEDLSPETRALLEKMKRTPGSHNEIDSENKEKSESDGDGDKNEIENEVEGTDVEKNEEESENEEVPSSPAGEQMKIDDTTLPFSNASEIGPAISTDPANANRALNEHDKKVQAELALRPQQQQMNQTRFNLTNGKVGKVYRYEFDLGAHNFHDITDYHIDGLEEVGLTFDPDTDLIEGTPKLPGDHVLELHYRIEGVNDDGPYFKKEIPLIINPDPRSLWKVLEPPTDSVYPKSNDDQLVVSTGEKRMVSASKRGRSHAHGGTHRDDDFKIEHLDDGWYLMAVADGAGSAKYSREGARIACDEVMEKLRTLGTDFDLDGLKSAITAYKSDPNEETSHPIVAAMYEKLGNAALNSYKAIEAEASKMDAAVKDYGTTLLTACCRKFDEGWFVAALWIGDGAIAIYSEDGTPTLLGKPDGGEFAGQTRFLTMPDTFEDLYKRVKFDIVDDFTALMLMTDGVSDPMFQTDHNLEQQEHWDKLWSEMHENVNFDPNNDAVGEEMLSWLDFWSPGNHDDRTIALLF